MFQPRLDKSAAPRYPANLQLPPWITCIVIAGAVLMGMGALSALVNPSALLAPGQPVNGAVDIYAGYLVSRNLALGLTLLICLKGRTWTGLSRLMLLTAVIQFLDAVIDAAQGRWALVPGVLLFAIVFFIASSRVSHLNLARRC